MLAVELPTRRHANHTNAYAKTLCGATGATLEDLREAVATLEDVERTARRVLGSAHPYTKGIERAVKFSRKKLRARETPPPPGDA